MQVRDGIYNFFDLLVSEQRSQSCDKWLVVSNYGNCSKKRDIFQSHIMFIARPAFVAIRASELCFCIIINFCSDVCAAYRLHSLGDAYNWTSCMFIILLIINSLLVQTYFSEQKPQFQVVSSSRQYRKCMLQYLCPSSRTNNSLHVSAVAVAVVVVVVFVTPSDTNVTCAYRMQL